MASAGIQLRYRPVRIAFCVRKGSLTQFESAVRLSCTMWGGAFNPIIAVDDTDEAKQLVRLHRIDALLAIDGEDHSIKNFIADFPELS